MNTDSFFAGKSGGKSGAVLLRALIPFGAVFCTAICVAFCASCGSTIPPGEVAAPSGRGTVRAALSAGTGLETGTASIASGALVADTASGAPVPDMERIAEIERTGVYFPGLALIESGLKEKAGDYTGSALAAYKELSWAYSYGSASREQVEEALQNALILYRGISYSREADRESALAAIGGCAAFSRGDWAQAEELLSAIPLHEEEPDSFLRWMLLVCALEKENSGARKNPLPENSPRGNLQAARAAYGSIRARYALFPEYWFRAARAFSTVDAGAAGERGIAGGSAGNGSIAAVYAEQCINASPHGPFAAESREILAEYFGISQDKISPDKNEIHLTIRTKAEIEDVVRSSVSVNNPLILEELFPLISLPENPFTLYAVGALKALSAVPDFKRFFAERAHKSTGRLGERLNYISRS